MIYLERKVDHFLRSWKEDEDRKPLIIKGPRQVGKTESILRFGKDVYKRQIGNSHTYFNDMPAMVAEKARKAGFDCEVTMIAHGGWYLEPVSYTHLDVYKRQVLPLASQERIMTPSLPTSATRKSPMRNLIPIMWQHTRRTRQILTP